MNRPWMPLYISDYLRDTSHLRALESGAYLHLIMAYWVNGRLPDDDRQLATIAKLSDKEWKTCKPCLAEFFGPAWKSHKRIDAELSHAAEVSNKRRSAVEEREKKRRSNDPSNDPSNDDTLHTTQSRKIKKDIRSVANATRPENSDFIEFWKVFPRRKGANPKHPAQKVFESAVRQGTDPQQIIAGAKRCAEVETEAAGTKFSPRATTWLSERRWEDYLASSEVPSLVDLPGFYAAFDSPELVAWEQHERDIGKSTPRDKNGGWRFATQWPPGHEPKSEAA